MSFVYKIQFFNFPLKKCDNRMCVCKKNEQNKISLETKNVELNILGEEIFLNP